MIAKIAVEGLIYSIDKPYSYAVPPATVLRPGQRVSVPFGRGNRVSEGMVLSVEEGEREGLKQILAVLDPEPVMTEGQLRLAAFVRERSFCTFYDAIHAMLPGGLWIENREIWKLEDLPADWEDRLSGDPVAVGVVRLLQSCGGTLSLEALFRQTGERKHTREAVEALRARRWLSVQTENRRKQSDKTERMVRCAASGDVVAEFLRKKRRSAPMQAAVMDLLATVDTVSWKELRYFTGASLQTLHALERSGMVEVYAEEVLRSPAIVPTDRDVSFPLNPDQSAVFEGLRRQMRSPVPGAALLQGVTGSGKTAVYIHLIRDCLANGKSAMLLVPEIALTPQLLSLFAACFGKQIAVMHSALPVGERFDAYKRVARGEARVVVGTRSAVFAPLQSPGVFILDEEQEHTYKSENSPRYHAREVALYRGRKEGALVLLGSATPSMESSYLARTGVYAFYRLDRRFNGKDLPEVRLVDMKQELLHGNAGSLSRPLVEAIAERLKKKEKTILLLNRRGGSRMVVCVDCGFVPSCPRCSVHLTYHMANERLMCHYCGHSEPLMDPCPACGGHLKRIGFGTQQLEYDLRQTFPGVEVLRMDADTITPTNPHEAVLRRFETEDVPILVGTQMVAKGLNFDDVTLVGVVDADMSLYVDHFRAAETTFDLVTQVVGRAGRGAKRGIALIQTFTPKNEVLLRASRQDYDGFFEAELSRRRLTDTPPFADLIQFGFTGFPESHVERCAAAFAGDLWQRLQDPRLRPAIRDLLGPAPAPIMKINEKYRFRLTLVCKNSRPLRQALSQAVQDFSRRRETDGVSIWVDINGYE